MLKYIMPRPQPRRHPHPPRPPPLVTHSNFCLKYAEYSNHFGPNALAAQRPAGGRAAQNRKASKNNPQSSMLETKSYINQLHGSAGGWVCMSSLPHIFYSRHPPASPYPGGGGALKTNQSSHQKIYPTRKRRKGGWEHTQSFSLPRKGPLSPQNMLFSRLPSGPAGRPTGSHLTCLPAFFSIQP